MSSLEKQVGSSAKDRQVGGNHYKDYPIQPIEYCQKNGLNFCESNAIKYLSRHRHKGGKEDLLKAIHNIELLIEMEYKEDETPTLEFTPGQTWVTQGKGTIVGGTILTEEQTLQGQKEGTIKSYLSGETGGITA